MQRLTLVSLVTVSALALAACGDDPTLDQRSGAASAVHEARGMTLERLAPVGGRS